MLSNIVVLPYQLNVGCSLVMYYSTGIEQEYIYSIPVLHRVKKISSHLFQETERFLRTGITGASIFNKLLKNVVAYQLTKHIIKTNLPLLLQVLIRHISTAGGREVF